MNDEDSEGLDFYYLPHFSQRRQKKLSTRKFVIIMAVAICTILAFGSVLIILISKREPDSTYTNRVDIYPHTQVIDNSVHFLGKKLPTDADDITKRLQSKLSDLDIGEEIGNSGSTKFYQSKRIPDNANVTVKVFEASTQFGLERSILDSLKSHPYVIHLWSYLIISSDDAEVAGLDGRFILVFEYPQNGTMLNHRLEKGAPVRKWFSQLVVTLEFIHSMGIIHRRIEAESVFIDANDNIRLANFENAIPFQGYRKQQDSSAFSIYSSPERILGEPFSYSSDIYSLGILFYHFYGANSLPDINQKLDVEKRKTEILMYAMNVQNWPLNKDVTWKEKDLYSQMVEPCVEKRISFSGIKAHPYFQGVDWAKMPHPP